MTITYPFTSVNHPVSMSDNKPISLPSDHIPVCFPFPPGPLSPGIGSVRFPFGVRFEAQHSTAWRKAPCSPTARTLHNRDTTLLEAAYGQWGRSQRTYSSPTRRGAPPPFRGIVPASPGLWEPKVDALVPRLGKQPAVLISRLLFLSLPPMRALFCPLVPLRQWPISAKPTKRSVVPYN